MHGTYAWSNSKLRFPELFRRKGSDNEAWSLTLENRLENKLKLGTAWEKAVDLFDTEPDWLFSVLVVFCTVSICCYRPDWLHRVSGLEECLMQSLAQTVPHCMTRNGVIWVSAQRAEFTSLWTSPIGHDNRKKFTLDRGSFYNSQSVSWCFEPSQPQRITSGLNTNFNLSPSYSFHKSHTITQILSTISEGKTRKTVTYFWAYLYSASTQHGNLHPAELPILFCWPTQEPMLATANTGKTREGFWKKSRWMDWKGRNKHGRNPWQ